MLDRIQRLHRAAQGRHEKTARRAEAALDALARSGDPVTVRGVAEAARVSRSWILQPRLLRSALAHQQRRPDLARGDVLTR